MSSNWTKRWILSAGVATIAVGVLVLVGWAYGNRVLIQFHPSYAPMQRNTALSFVLCGIGFLLANGSSFWRKGSGACAGAVGTLAFFTLLEYLFSIDLRIDQALGPAWASDKAPYAGRMSPLTACCFMLIATAMASAWWRSGSRRSCWVVALASTLSSAIALASLFSYLLGASTMLHWVAVTWMALHTATCFLVLGSGLLVEAWSADLKQQAPSKIIPLVQAPSWAPLCTGIGAGSVLLALIQSALSGDGPQHSVLQVAEFLAAVILTMVFLILVPMSFKHRVTTGLCMALAVFLFTSYFSFHYLALETASQAWVSHTHEVLMGTSDVNIHLRQATAGYRSYYWTGKTVELEQWQQTIDMARHDLSRLRVLTSDNPVQQHALDEIGVLFDKTVKGIEQRVAFQQQRGTTAGLDDIRTSQPLANMHSVQLLALGMQEEERRLMQLRMAASADDLSRTKLVVALSDGLAILFLAAAGAIAGMEFGARKRSESALTAAREKLTMALAAGSMGTWELDLATDLSWRSFEHDRIFGYNTPLLNWGKKNFFAHVYPDDLEQVQSAFAGALRDGRLSCETRILRADKVIRWIAIEGSVLYDEEHVAIKMTGILHDITASKELHSRIRQLNDDLELRVSERTLELTAANQELEAFTYSAAHDLRAPLRHMNSFVSFLHQEWYERLDPVGQRYLDKIANSSKDMGILLDDLLKFSSLSKVELRRNQVSLQRMVEHIREELAPELKNRDLTWEIGNLPDVPGDRTLLKQVLMHLIGNAVKFTRKSQGACIRVGSQQQSDESVTIFVTDNGAGFEMKYVNKLFGVFQRLHNAHDYEGSGIGLAIVRRIVERHGGRVWAEGVPGRGATFQFSLPIRGETDGTHWLHTDGRR